MLKGLFYVSVILFTLTSVCFAGSTPDMREGKWEITTKMEMPGMPMSIPPSKHTQCLTKKDLIPQNTQSGQECQISQSKVTGNTVTWSIKCSGEGGETKGTGTMTYSGDNFKGTMKISMPYQNMEMTSTIDGRRIGDCK